MYGDNIGMENWTLAAPENLRNLNLNAWTTLIWVMHSSLLHFLMLTPSLQMQHLCPFTVGLFWPFQRKLSMFCLMPVILSCKRYTLLYDVSHQLLDYPFRTAVWYMILQDLNTSFLSCDIFYKKKQTPHWRAFLYRRHW